VTWGEQELAGLLERAGADARVIGVVLFGSRAWGQAVDERSDYDVLLLAVDEAAVAELERELPFVRGARIEIVSDTVDGLRAHAEIGSRSEWARPSYAHARVLLDKTGGELERIVAEKHVQPEEGRLERARAQLDTYLNSYHRSARNRLVGFETAARLDAAESIPPFLATIFLLEGRVRPFNKHLAWELGERPLAEAAWARDVLLPRLERILDGDLAEQQALFRDVERVARAAGLGGVIDGWEPDVAWLRGEGGYHEAPPARGPSAPPEAG
jgi:predicted nucleotidyltransferase